MFKKLLVPLDGSHLAEAALPAAAYLAERTGASTTLIHLIEQHPPEAVHGERHLATTDDSLNYLNEVSQKFFSAQYPVESHVHTSAVSHVPVSIADHAVETDADLIVMCVHGPSGIHRWLSGSIAQQVIGLSTASILLIQPASSGALPPFTCDRLLVALDGDPVHEKGLTVATELARACSADLHLLMVVPTLATLPEEKAETGKLLPGAMSALLDLSEEDARQYLEDQVKRVTAEGVAATSAVGRGDPAQGIVRTAESIQADVIVLGTHGKRGMDAFWSGSVAPKVASMSRSPMLLVPVR
jgi:nucleotide-binding universal stress UspA family protein